MARIPEPVADTRRDSQRRDEIKYHCHRASMQRRIQVAQLLWYYEAEDGARVVRVPLRRRVRDRLELKYLAQDGIMALETTTHELLDPIEMPGWEEK